MLMLIDKINRDDVTENQVKMAVSDFTHGMLYFAEKVGGRERLESGKVITLDFGKEGVLLSKSGDILTVHRVDTEEKEADLPRYKYDLGEEELVYFDTKENRYYEPCFQVYVQIQMWDYQISSDIRGGVPGEGGDEL